MSSWSRITASARFAWITSWSSPSLPLPTYVAGSGSARLCTEPRDGLGARRVGERRELVQVLLRHPAADADQHGALADRAGATSRTAGIRAPPSVRAVGSSIAGSHHPPLPGEEPELAEHLVQHDLRLGAGVAVADDQPAGQAVAPGGERRERDPGTTTARGGTTPAMLDGLGPGDVDHGHAAGQDDARRDHRLAPDPDALHEHDARADERTVLHDHRRRLQGSSTPPIPTPPERWTSAPICAHEPTVAHVSTIVPGPTHAPMFT